MTEFDGRKILLIFLYGLLIILLIILTFFLVTYLLKKGEVFKPKPASGEFPTPPLSGFPSAPQFIEIAGYYFEGPWSLIELQEKKVIKNPELYELYAILCKKEKYDKIDYDIIYIGETGEEQVQEKCLLENCNQKAENLYIALFHTDDKNKVREYLNNQVNPVCNL